MAVTYNEISTLVLGSNTTVVDLSSIPSGYTDLRVVVMAGATGNFFMNCQINGLTTSIYRNERLANYSASSWAGSFELSTRWQFGEVPTDSFPALATWVFDFRRYSSSHSIKTVQFASTDYARPANAMWTRRGVASIDLSAAISTISFIAQSNEFASNSIFTLYGITEA